MKASLEELLGGKKRFEEAIQIDDTSGLHYLLAAGASTNPQALLESPRFDDLLRHARRNTSS